MVNGGADGRRLAEGADERGRWRRPAEEADDVEAGEAKRLMS